MLDWQTEFKALDLTPAYQLLTMLTQRWYSSVTSPIELTDTYLDKLHIRLLIRNILLDEKVIQD